MKFLIILEGISGSGKSTVQHHINVARNYQDYHIHRLVATEYVYGILYHRPISLKNLQKIEKKFCRVLPTVLVLLTCNEKIARSRKEVLRDKYVEKDLRSAQNLFKKWYETYSVIPRKILVDTSYKTIEEITTQIVDKLNEWEDSSNLWNLYDNKK